MIELETLPEGWELVSLQDVLLKIVGGGTPSKKIHSYYQGNIPWFSVKDMKSIRPTDSLQHITEDAIAESATNLIPANTIVMATRIALGKAIKPTIDFTINQDLKALFLPIGMNSNFILYWIIYNEKNIYDLGSGTTVKGITLETLNNLEFLLPPENEQTRIVEKLEELLSDLDNGVAELKAAQTKLSQYRQSLLKSAVEGSLTAEWRKQNPVTETGEQLLQRILTERRQRWEQQKLAEFKEKGKTPPKDWQKKYPEPVQPDTSELPELPEGWVWASVDQLAEIGTGVTPLKSRNDFYNKGTIPWVTSGAVNNEIIKEGNSFVTETAVTECRLKLYPAGTLLVAMYGEGKTRGKCSELSFPATINQALAALVMEESASCVKEHLKIFLLDSYQKMRSQASGGVQPNLNLLIVRSMCVPLPPIEEQQAISNIVSQQREDIESQRQTVNFSLQAIEAQRKNILKDAFSGKLVKQDPNDDSASVLLEKIKAEREARASQPKLKQVKKKLKTMKNIDIQSLKDWITKHNKNNFKFTDIESGLSADYDNLKELVFVALSESNPIFAQRFDEKLGEIVFEKVSA